MTDGSLGCICITGGTGSFGQAFTRFILAQDNSPHIRIYSRDEHKQEMMARAFDDDRLTFILGDVRDERRLRLALDDCDAVVHAAALKVVAQGEQHVTEFIDVDVAGTEAVINSAIAAGVRRALLISSDKAVQPINTYGACKMLAERIFIYANQLSVSRGLRFAVVRGGNVWSSQGSVIEKWRQQQANAAPIEVYNPDTLRFHLPMKSWCAFVWRALREMHGGEICVPKLRAWRLGDLADAFGGVQRRIEKSRNGDKLSEMLIAPHEASRTINAGWAYVIEPPDELRDVWNYQPWQSAGDPLQLYYGSETVERMSVDELKRLIQ